MRHDLCASSPSTAADVITPARWSWLDVLLLVVVLAITTWVRASHIDPVPSLDELWHLADTTGHGSALSEYPFDVVIVEPRRQTALDDAKPVFSLWLDQRGVIHPPLFLIALRLWRDVVGQGEFAAHWFSITWGAVCLAFLYAATRLATSRWLAACVTLGFGCAATQVYIAQEIRPYAMLTAISAVALWLMTCVAVLGPTRRRAIALGLCTLALVMTHYFALGGALAIGLYGVIALRPHRRAFLVTIGACALFFLVAWVPLAIRQIPDMNVSGPPTAIPPFDRLMILLATPFRVFADRLYTTDPISVVTGVLFVLPWLLVRRFRPLLPWTIWLCGTVGCIVLLDTARGSNHLLVVRYLALVAPAVPLVFVGCVWPLRRGLAYLVAAGLFGVGFTYLISRTDVIIEVPEYGEVAKIVATRSRTEEAVVLVDRSGMSRAPVWLMTLTHDRAFARRPVVMLTRPLTPAMLAELGSTTLWYIADAGSDPSTFVPGSRIVETHHEWEAIQICKLELDADAHSPTAAGRQ